ncbi:MAG: RecQ family ATP-dependent DNA helicase [Prevotellaceae bacterium]|jgi:ATP-dependent DNA helicase RecQ|nr:RecQ family ATP-dependent DNA helicase [Prevotellaceae bacterium]
MQTFFDILKRYWGYDSFRPLQADIINSIASGKDTLGLMPTGGGKSLTFQVPALAAEGVCIVITPLIALMKDQVENLKQREIPAAAIYSGMSTDQIRLTLDNAVFEAYKFLYVSPERLATTTFIEKIKQMNVCMIAVDESHCISQWGYDFRPSYLKIADIRHFLPDVPVLALTATATPEVVDDIQEKLQFGKKNVFRKSFYRENLTYFIKTTENKNDYLLRILQKVKGTSIVYVRSRKKTKETADFLKENGITAAHYHAGLSNREKDNRQQAWKSGEIRVMAATNAFGMGIDKPDVRTVIHLDLPDSLEAYFQEAGRGGRDEKRSFAVLLYNKSDAVKIKKRISDTFPEKDRVRKVYESLGNYFQLAVGSGLGFVFPFDVVDFCSKFHLPILITHSCLKILEQAGYISLTDEQESSSRLMFLYKKDDLYDSRHSENQERLINTLLRLYTGIFSEFAYIREEVVAERLGWSTDEVYQQLIALGRERIIKYIPHKRTPFLTFVREREETDLVILGREAYEDRKKRYEKRVNHVLEYVQECNICRSRMLLRYFGEKNTHRCGHCDVCLTEKETGTNSSEFDAIREEIITLLSGQTLSIYELIRSSSFGERKLFDVIRLMVDHDEIIQNDRMELSINIPLSNPSNRRNTAL